MRGATYSDIDLSQIQCSAKFTSVLLVLDSVNFKLSGMESPINRLSEG